MGLARMRIPLAIGGFVVALGWLGADSLAAQEPGVVRGQVTAEVNRAPLQSVQVYVPGTGQGTLTDESGRYRLEVPAGEVEVRAQLIGYREASRTITARAGETTTVDFTLGTAALELDEIVVTGTAGGEQKRALGNVVEQLDAGEVVEKTGAQEVSQVLQARTPGVTIKTSTGQVGSGPNIRVRGVSTFSLNDHPLIYVDGVRVDNGVGKGISVQGFGSGVQSALNDLNPTDIESIEVIKGPAAATLYGTEASNGVIQIITKQGGAGGEPTIQAFVRQGANWFRDAEERIPQNWGIDPDTGEPFKMNLFETERQLGNQIFQTGRSQEYGVSIRGGTADLRYYLSTSYNDQTGIEPTNWAERFSARGNFGIAPHEDWQIDVGIGLSHQQKQVACEAGCGGLMWSTLFALPSRLDTPYRGFFSGPPEFLHNWIRFPHSSIKATYSLSMQWEPAEWLTQRLIVGQDIADDEAEEVVERLVDPALTYFLSESAAKGWKFRQHRRNVNTTFDYSATASFGLTGSLASNASVGAQYFRKRTEYETLFAREFPAPGLSVTAAASNTETGADDFVQNNTLGVYAQEQLVWNDRLYFTGALRVDDNSAFGRDFDLVTYPKASASWVVSEEPFFDVGLFDRLRLRAAYGQAGQQPEAFAALRTYSPVTAGDGSAGLTPGSVGNTVLAPERGTEFEAGFDAGVFGERLGVALTYYNTRTKDAILTRDVSPSTGFPSVQYVNAGEIASQGLEFQMNGLALDMDAMSVDFNLSLSKVSNEVIDLGGIDEGAGYIAAGAIRHVPGLPVAAWFDQKTVSAELTEDGEAINAMCDSGDPNGITLPDGTPVEAGGTPVPCEEAPNLYLGKSTPDFTGSFSTTLTLFDRLELYGLVDWQWGWKKFDNNIRIRCQIFLTCRENMYPHEYDPVRIAEMQSPNTLRTFVFSDASFLKFREISLTYDVPQSLFGRTGIGAERMSISLAGRNLFPTLTDYSGLDPEAEFQEFGFTRLEQNNTPPLAQFVGSVRVTF